MTEQCNPISLSIQFLLGIGNEIHIKRSQHFRNHYTDSARALFSQIDGQFIAGVSHFLGHRKILSRVSLLTFCLSPRKARDTVDLEIPKAWAMSMMVVYSWRHFLLTLQRYEKKASFWERLRILGTVAGTVAKDKCIKFIFHLISSV